MELDLTKPDTGRIIDYWLGGHHNFDVDRTAAERIATYTPTAPDWVRAQREFLQRAVWYMHDGLGIRRFLVGGAGLPTCGNVHEVAPQARVLYTDISPVTIAYGKYILGDNPNVRYVHCNVTKLHSIDPALLVEALGDEGPIGLVLIGIVYFFPDAVLTEALQSLFGWVPAGSALATSFIGRDAEEHASGSLMVYKQMGTPLHPRNRDEIAAVMTPWHLNSHGIATATQWGRAPRTSDGPEFVFGCVAVKPSTDDRH